MTETPKSMREIVQRELKYQLAAEFDRAEKIKAALEKSGIDIDGEEANHGGYLYEYFEADARCRQHSRQLAAFML